jgi:DNA helicase HerA-like ATPase
VVGLADGRGLQHPGLWRPDGDVPIEPTAGELIADLIVDRELSAVIDVSQFLASEQARFATAFVSQLFQRKKAAPSPVHIFIEEAQEFVPQNAGAGETHLVHAFERMIKLGRNFGMALR